MSYVSGHASVGFGGFNNYYGCSTVSSLKRASLKMRSHQGATSLAIHQPPVTSHFKWRLFLSIVLLILTTVEVSMVLNSGVYMRGQLLRSFLSFYLNDESFPELFEGNAYYANIRNATDLQYQMKRMCRKMAKWREQSWVQIDYGRADISLQVQYNPGVEFSTTQQQIYPLDPSQCIVKPFNVSNVTDIKHFLLRVHYYEVVVENLPVTSGGLQQMYSHRVVFHYDDGNEIQVEFDLSVIDALESRIDFSRPQTNPLLLYRIFYLFIIGLSTASLYFHLAHLRRSAHGVWRAWSGGESGGVLRWAVDRGLQLWAGVVANILQLVGNLQLLFGREYEVLIGLACLSSWLTVFGVLRGHKPLMLMYELIKLSMVKIIQFMLGFFIIFIGYTLLGMCLFPRVSFFFTLADAVTTLASMMAGDSVSMITFAITARYSTFLAMLYIFSFIILFMHAIHNTLTSLIKEYFIIKKIEIIKEEKARLGEEGFLYLGEIKNQNEAKLRSLPLKLNPILQRDLLRIRVLGKFSDINKILRQRLMQLEALSLREKWDLSMLKQTNQVKACYQTILRNRLQKIWAIQRHNENQ